VDGILEARHRGVEIGCKHPSYPSAHYHTYLSA
jgi:hypothetical protein